MTPNSGVPATTLWFLGLACLLVLVASLCVAYLAWREGRYMTMAIDSFLAGINLMLACINWFWLTPKDR